MFLGRPDICTLGEMKRCAVALACIFALATALPATPASANMAFAAKDDSTMFKGLFRRDKKPAPASDLTALQQDAVRSIAGDLKDLQDGEWEDREWVYFAVNHEILVEDGLRSSTQASVLAHRPGADLEDLDFRLSRESKARLLALRDAMGASGKSLWTIVDVTVDRDGNYDFSFGYGPPPRINGDLLHSPLTGLLDRYLDQKAGRK